MKIEEYNLVDYIGEPALLEQVAEECLELAFACLKLARMKRGDNIVHGHTEDELIKNIEEELADVSVCGDQLIAAGFIDYYAVKDWVDKKYARMFIRLEEEDKKNKKGGI